MNFKELDILLTNFLMSIGIWGYILSCFLIIIESIIPILPLSVFITLLFYKFGYILGFLISYVFTILGCLISYSLFNGKMRIKLENYIRNKNKKKLDKIIKSINRIKFVNLCLIIALPFAPAFLINIAAGLSNIKKKKYIIALLIGKIFLIIFWGFIGTSMINSLRRPSNLVLISVLLLVCFILSRFISKKEGLE